jgi:hypothetical protein
MSDDFSYRLRTLYADRGPVIIAVGAVIGSLALLCLFTMLLLQSQDSEEPSTADPEAVATSAASDEFQYVAVSESGSISVTLETPIFLNIAGEDFSVEPVAVPEDGPWTPSTSNETTAAWVYSSVINYVFGLDDTNDNRDLLERLVIGDEVVLTTRSGSSSSFVVSSRQEVSSDNMDIFAQRAPAVTIVLLEEDLGEQRIMVQGRFVSSDSTIDDTQVAGRVVEIGETAQLESLQISVTGVSYQVDRPEAPPGFAFLQIDYQVQNVGTETVDSNSLTMVLADDMGNLYALNPTASQLGNYRPLGGTIAPGQTIVATAGYQIPTGLSSEVLRWQVTVTKTNSQIQVNIPFRDPTVAGQQAAVEVADADVTTDGTGLLITGNIINNGDQALVVEVTDVGLSSNGTVHLMLSTNPAFPWTLAAGQRTVFAVTFQRPAGDPAVFRVINHSFQLTGLR